MSQGHRAKGWRKLLLGGTSSEMEVERVQAKKTGRGNTMRLVEILPGRNWECEGGMNGLTRTCSYLGIQ